MAVLGLNTLVDTTVAIAFGESVHPFTNIDAQTKTITKTSPTIVTASSYHTYLMG